MGFEGLDPTVMRELSSRSGAVSQRANDIAGRVSSLITEHQLDDFVGDLGTWFTQVQDDMADLSSLAERKASDMEILANGGFAALCFPPWPFPCDDDTRDEILDKIRDDINKGDDEGMSVWELWAVRDRLKDLSDEDRAWVIGQLSDEELALLLKNVDQDHGFWPINWGDGDREDFDKLIATLPPEVQERILRLRVENKELEAVAKTEGDPKAKAALDRLRNSDGYDKLSPEQKLALMSQVVNYPNEKSIYNLGRLASKQWARNFRIGDFQRSAKMVAYQSQYPDGDATVNGNTLDAYLADDATYRWDWNAESGTYGSALNGVTHLSRDYLDAGNKSVEDSVPDGMDLSDTIHLVVSTLAHETNHLRNEDEVTVSFDYFMGEYRAYYVDYIAEHGHPPPREHMARIVEHMLSSSSGAYGYIAAALQSETEGPRIAAFVSQMLGEDVPPDQVLDKLKNVPDKDKPAPEPVSVDGGPNNLDNAP